MEPEPISIVPVIPLEDRSKIEVVKTKKLKEPKQNKTKRNKEDKTLQEINFRKNIVKQWLTLFPITRIDTIDQL